MHADGVRWAGTFLSAQLDASAVRGEVEGGDASFHDSEVLNPCCLDIL